MLPFKLTKREGILDEKSTFSTNVSSKHLYNY